MSWTQDAGPLPRRVVDVVVLALAAGLSLVVLVAPDFGLEVLVARSHQAGPLRFGPERVLWTWRLVSTATILLLYLVTDGGRSLRVPRESIRGRAARVGLVWLAIVALATFVFNRGTVSYFSPQSAVLFIGVGVVAEELLFRGVLFVLVERAFAGTRWSPSTAAIVITAVLFGLGHLQYYGFNVARTWDLRSHTLLLGLVLGWLRSRTDSIGPPIVVHAIGNALAMIAGSV